MLSNSVFLRYTSIAVPSDIVGYPNGMSPIPAFSVPIYISEWFCPIVHMVIADLNHANRSNVTVSAIVLLSHIYACDSRQLLYPYCGLLNITNSAGHKTGLLIAEVTPALKLRPTHRIWPPLLFGFCLAERLESLTPNGWKEVNAELFPC